MASGRGGLVVHAICDMRCGRALGCALVSHMGYGDQDDELAPCGCQGGLTQPRS
jgi:hypothetical protein